MMEYDRSWIFVHIQKTGGDSIRCALGLPLNEPTKHFLARELLGLYGPETWEACWKFAVVRNPWDRLVSWWSMINARRSAIREGAPANRFMRYIVENAVTFEEFLTRCDAEITDTDGRKRVLRPQIDYLIDENGHIIVDYIGRFERLAEDFRAISSRTAGQILPLPTINTSKREHYSQYYSPSLRDLVGERFQSDISAFKYKFEEQALTGPNLREQ